MKKTIQKVLNELKQATPDLSYIRGLLEGLVEEEDGPILTKEFLNKAIDTFKESSNYTKSDEQEEIPAHLRPGPIGNLTA